MAEAMHRRLEALEVHESPLGALADLLADPGAASELAEGLTRLADAPVGASSVRLASPPVGPQAARSALDAAALCEQDGRHCLHPVHGRHCRAVERRYGPKRFACAAADCADLGDRACLEARARTRCETPPPPPPAGCRAFQRQRPPACAAGLYREAAARCFDADTLSAFACEDGAAPTAHGCCPAEPPPGGWAACDTRPGDGAWCELPEGRPAHCAPPRFVGAFERREDVDTVQLRVLGLPLTLEGCRAECQADPDCAGFDRPGPEGEPARCTLLRSSRVRPPPAERTYVRRGSVLSA